ncbi:MAG TPA: hypothetical protein VML01_01605 [Bryobacterales bacterium]|nr:hypothetical protein [Bryobacterales bacterium]
MNERILIGFKRNDEIVSVTGFSADPNVGGIILEDETSALARGFGLTVTPANAVTKEKVFRVQQRMDWLKTRDFRLHVSRQGRRLQVEGVEAEALPAGRYNVEFMLSGVDFKKSEWKNVQIPEDGTLDLEFEEKPAAHRFELSTPPGNFDAESKTILQASTLDGKQADLWIQPGLKHRDRRKACLMNILAKLAVVPSRDGRLNQFVRKVFFTEMDRIYAEVEPRFFEIVKSDFLPKDATVHGTHKRLFNKIGVSRDDYELRSHREKKGSGALQIVGAAPKQGGDVAFVDIDIDGANPGFDGARFIIHVGHLFRPGKTDHLKLRKKIAGQTSDFLYYKAVKV